VGQPGDRLRLALKAVASVGVGTDLGSKDLEGDRPIKARIAGLVDLAHAPGA
jgi:hypothetical protein